MNGVFHLVGTQLLFKCQNRENADEEGQTVTDSEGDKGQFAIGYLAKWLI